MNFDPNEPAYPVPIVIVPQPGTFTSCRESSPGLTKREELIFRIAAGLATAPGWISDPNEAAQWAIQRAYAVLAEMNREKV